MTGNKRNRGGAWALALGALVLTAGVARAGEGDDELEALREELRRTRAEQEELRREVQELKEQRPPAASELDHAIGEVVDRAGADAEGGLPRLAVRRPGRGLDIGGYFSTKYESSEEPGSRSSFVDMRLVPQIHADISQNIAFDTEVEIEHGGISDEVDGEIFVEFAELTFTFSEEFRLKAGTLLVPFGHFNLNHDDPMNELSSRPRVARYVVPAAFDLPGVGVEGTLELTEDAVMTYDVILTNGFRDEFDSESGARDARFLFEDDDNHDKTLFARVALIPQVDGLDALSVGLSGALGELGEKGQHDLRGFGVDAQAIVGPWEFAGEYDAFTIDRASGAAPPRNATTGDLGPVRGLSGYYLQLVHRIRNAALRSLPFADDNASMGLVVRYDNVDLNDRVRGASPQDDERAWSFGINYRPTARTVVKIEYRMAKSAASGPDGNQRDVLIVEFATYF